MTNGLLFVYISLYITISSGVFCAFIFLLRRTKMGKPAPKLTKDRIRDTAMRSRTWHVDHISRHLTSHV